MQNLQNTEKEMIAMERKLTKTANLSEIYPFFFVFFWMEARALDRMFKRGKLMYFLITISIANPAIQLLTQNVNKEL